MSDDGNLLPPDIADEIPRFLEKELRKQSRDPFARALQRILQHRPSQQALVALANKPDKWAIAVSTLAALAGYEKGINVTLHVKPVDQLTDRELIDEYHRGQAQLAALARGVAGEVQEAELVPALPEPTKTE